MTTRGSLATRGDQSCAMFRTPVIAAQTFQPATSIPGRHHLLAICRLTGAQGKRYDGAPSLGIPMIDQHVLAAAGKPDALDVL